MKIYFRTDFLCDESEDPEFHANRPFIYSIRDVKINASIFSGRFVQILNNKPLNFFNQAHESVF